MRILIIIFSIFCIVRTANAGNDIINAYYKNLSNKNYSKAFKCIYNSNNINISEVEFVNFYKYSYLDSLNIELLKWEMTNEQFASNYYKVLATVQVKYNNSKADTIKEYLTIRAINNDYKILWNKIDVQTGNNLLYQGMYDEAIKAYKKGLEINPYDATCMLSIALVYYKDLQLSQSDAANLMNEQIIKARKLEPQNDLLTTTTAMYYKMIEMPELAIKYLKEGVQLNCSLNDKVNYLTNIAQTYVQLERLDSAFFFCFRSA